MIQKNILANRAVPSPAPDRDWARPSGPGVVRAGSPIGEQGAKLHRELIAKERSEKGAADAPR